MSPPSFDRPAGPPDRDSENPGASSPADAPRRPARTQFEYRAAQLDLRTTEPFAAVRPPPPLAPAQLPPAQPTHRPASVPAHPPAAAHPAHARPTADMPVVLRQPEVRSHITTFGHAVQLPPPATVMAHPPLAPQTVQGPAASAVTPQRSVTLFAPSKIVGATAPAGQGGAAPAPHGVHAPSAFGAPVPAPYGVPAPSAFGAPVPAPYGVHSPSAFGAPVPAPHGVQAPSPFGASVSPPYDARVPVAPVYGGAASYSSAPPRAPAYEPPPAPVYQPPPAPVYQPAPVPVHEAAPAPSVHQSAPESYAPPPSHVVADVEAQAAPLLSRTTRSTEFVDIRSYLEQEVPLPELGNNEDSSPRWNTLPRALGEELSSAVRAPITSRPVPLRSDSGMRARDASDAESDGSDLERSIRTPVPRVVLLAGACVVALAMVGLSLLFKPRPESQVAAPGMRAPVSVAASPGPSSATALPGSPGRTARTEAATAEPATAEPANADPTSAEPAGAEPTSPQPARVHEAAQRHARHGVREGAPAAPRAAEDGAERGGATQQSAAALYLKGQYKEALAEYRLLASAYPEHKAYGEFARILKRKLFDTCVRTQPNRREQCKQL